MYQNKNVIKKYIVNIDISLGMEVFIETFHIGYGRFPIENKCNIDLILEYKI